MAPLQSKAETPVDMSVIDAIRHRRATRSFTNERVGDAAIHSLLDAAIRAPTAMHEEPWEFAIVQDKAVLKRLSDDAKAAMRDEPNRVPGFTLPDNIFYDAGTLIVIYGKPMGPFVVADCWLAAENLMLAACAMGLGTCVIGLALTALNSAKWKAELKVPPDVTAYAPIIVGAPRGAVPASSRNDPRILSWNAGAMPAR